MLSMLRPEGNSTIDHSRNDQTLSKRTLDNDDFVASGIHDNMITVDITGSSI